MQLRQLCRSPASKIKPKIDHGSSFSLSSLHTTRQDDLHSNGLIVNIEGELIYKPIAQ